MGWFVNNFMLTIIIDYLAQIITAVISTLGYPGVFLLMAAESCGIPMPSEIIMPFAGWLVLLGKLNFWWVVIIGTLGNLAGSVAAYWIGRAGGRPLLEKYGKYVLLSHHDLDVADDWFKKYGDITVLIGRLLPVVRTYISFPAGVAEMSQQKFIFYTTLGVIPWSILFTWLGLKMGEHWTSVREFFHNFDLLIIALLIMFILLYIYRHLKRKKYGQS